MPVTTKLEKMRKRARPEPESIMLYINGKNFRCNCGANVFTKFWDALYGEVFSCNGCNLEYQGDKV